MDCYFLKSSRFSWAGYVISRPPTLANSVSLCSRVDVRAHDVFDLHAAHQQRIADERTVATPRHRFRAHDDSALGARQFQEPNDSLLEFSRAM